MKLPKSLFNIAPKKISDSIIKKPEIVVPKYDILRKQCYDMMENYYVLIDRPEYTSENFSNMINNNPYVIVCRSSITPKIFSNITIKKSTIILSGFDSKEMDDSDFTNTKFLCDTLFVFDCDKKFVYQHLDKQIFPNVSTLYLISHPSDPSVLHRNFDKIYLSDFYKEYKNEWVDNWQQMSDKENNANVILMNNQTLEKELDSYNGDKLYITF